MKGLKSNTRITALIPTTFPHTSRLRWIDNDRFYVSFNTAEEEARSIDKYGLIQFINNLILWKNLEYAVDDGAIYFDVTTGLLKLTTLENL